MNMFADVCVSHVNMCDVTARFDEFREKVVTFGVDTYSIFVAMVNAPGIYNDPVCREARGIVFSQQGLVSRPLHKFFNYGENAMSDKQALADRKIVEILEKRDGTMIHSVKSEQEGWLLKTKKSITGDGFEELKTIRRWVDERPDYCEMFQHAVDEGITVICEWTAPTNRIVVEYTEPRLTVLHFRNNETGEYFTRDQIQDKLNEWFEECGYEDGVLVEPISKEFGHITNLDDLVTALAPAKDTEGVVVLLDNMDMVKFKTPWYLSLHHTLTALTERNVFDAIMDETIDDIKSALYLADRHKELALLTATEDYVFDKIHAAEECISQAYVLGQRHRNFVGTEKQRFEVLKSLVSEHVHHEFDGGNAFLQIALNHARSVEDADLDMEKELEIVLQKLQFRKKLRFNSICGFGSDE